MKTKTSTMSSSEPSNTTELSMLSASDMENIGLTLHRFAAENNKKYIKKILKLGINVDSLNAAAQTPLFSACLESSDAASEYLLKHGAYPNARSVEGSTPVHAAAYSGNPKLLSKLIEAGGDLRLHDNKGRSVREWAACQPDQKKKKKMLEFIEETKQVAMSNSGRDLLQERQTNQYIRTLRRDGVSLSHLLGIGSKLKTLSLSSVQSLGYGKVYFGGGDQLGAIGSIPIVQESNLKHDEFGFTFTNGPFMVMESMIWNKVPVTVKRLHRDPPEGGIVDLLIKENEYMSRLRHPNILLLMGLCQTNYLEGLVLLYERVGCGSLYYHLYQRVESIDTVTMCEMLRQICEALIYIHQQNLLHCSLSSHAIQVISPGFAKLSNFEYMIENVKQGDTGPFANVCDNRYSNAVYNWLAPEVVANQPVTEKSDVYSTCAIIWEVLTGQPPWSGVAASDIQNELIINRKGLELGPDIKRPFDVMLKYGLAIEPKARALSLEKLRDVMSKVIVEHDSMGLKGDTPRPPRPKAKAPAPPPPQHQTTRVAVKVKEVPRKDKYTGAGIEGPTPLISHLIQKVKYDLNPSLEKFSNELGSKDTESQIVEEEVIEKIQVDRTEQAGYCSTPASKENKDEIDGPCDISERTITPRSASRSASTGTANLPKINSLTNCDDDIPSPIPSASTNSYRSRSSVPCSFQEIGGAPPVTSSPLEHKITPRVNEPVIHDSDVPDNSAFDRKSCPFPSGSESDTPPPLPSAPNPALLEAIRDADAIRPMSSVLTSLEPPGLRSSRSSGSTTPTNPFKTKFQNAPSDSEERLFRGLQENPPMSRFHSTTNAYLASLTRRSSEEVKSKSTVYGTLLREYSHTNAVPRPWMPCQDEKDNSSKELMAENVPSMSELKAAPGTSKHHYSGNGLSPSPIPTGRSNISTMSSSISNRSTQDRSSHSWSTSYKDSDTSYTPASHKGGENVSPSKGITPSAHPVFGVPIPANIQLKPTSPHLITIGSSPNLPLGSNNPRQGVPKGRDSPHKVYPWDCTEPPAEMPSARKSIDKPDGIFKATILSMFKPGDVKLKPVPPKPALPVDESTSQSDLDTSIRSTKKSPRVSKRFKAAGKSIKDIISSFQNHANEHFKKQAILQLKSKKRPSGEYKANIEEIKTTLHEGQLSIPEAIPEKAVCDSQLSPRYVQVVQSDDRNKEHELKRVDYVLERKTSALNVQLQRVVEIGPQHLHRGGKCVIIDCPVQQNLPQRTMSLHSTTDSEVSDVVRKTILSAHEDVVHLKTSTDCPHKQLSLEAAREQLAKRRQAYLRPAQTSQTPVGQAVNSASPNSSSGSSVKLKRRMDRCYSDFDTPSGQHSQATISLEIRSSRGNSVVKTPTKSLGYCASSPSTNTKPPTGSGKSTSHSAPIISRNKAGNLPETPEATQQEQHSDDSLTNSPMKGDIEEIYFDDELQPELIKEDHMRLQSTLCLDGDDDNSLLDDKPLFPDVCDTSTPCVSDVERGDKNGCGEPFVSSPGSKREDTDVGYHGDQNTSMSSTATEGYDTVDGEDDGIVKIEKHLSRSEEEGFTTTVTVKSDGQGSHTISHKKTDLNTGDTKTTFKKKVKATQVITKVIVDDDFVDM